MCGLDMVVTPLNGWLMVAGCGRGGDNCSGFGAFCQQGGDGWCQVCPVWCHDCCLAVAKWLILGHNLGVWTFVVVLATDVHLPPVVKVRLVKKNFNRLTTPPL